jgi:hypothetical protein
LLRRALIRLWHDTLATMLATRILWALSWLLTFRPPALDGALASDLESRFYRDTVSLACILENGPSGGAATGAVFSSDALWGISNTRPLVPSATVGFCSTWISSLEIRKLTARNNI